MKAKVTFEVELQPDLFDPTRPISNKLLESRMAALLFGANFKQRESFIVSVIDVTSEFLDSPKPRKRRKDAGQPRGPKKGGTPE